ncbi:MAG: OmpA family protein [Longimicrobiales bacterium]
MQSRRTRLHTAVRGGSVLMVAALVGCGYAKRDDVDAQMVQLRQDMETADQGVESRLDGKITAIDGRVGTLEERAAALERELQTMRTEFNASIQRLEGMMAFNVPVHFGFDEAAVREQDTEVLRRFATVVKDYYPNAVVTVEGFADPAGSRGYNLDLGQRRAQAVKDLLLTEGLTDGSVKVVSYGEATDRQVVPGAQGPEAGEQNRRVSLVIDYTGTVSVTTQPITN